MRPLSLAALCCLALLSSCVTAKAVVDSNVEFKPTGTIAFLGGNASFDENRVIGPIINLTRRTDGSWGGRIQEAPIDVDVYPGRIGGVDFTMKYAKEGNKWVITGQFRGSMHRFEVSPAEVQVRMSKASFSLGRHSETSYGPGDQLKVTGEASKEDPPLPQFAFAMLATFMAMDH